MSHHFSQIAELALKNRLPAISPFNQFTEAGGAVAYGPHLPDLFRQLADYVDRILKGSSPGDLPIQRPTRFVLIVNLKTTKAIGLTVPQTVIEVLKMLANDEPLAGKQRDDALTGEWRDHRDCHIKPDLVLIYRKPGDGVLQLVHLGSHSELGL